MFLGCMPWPASAGSISPYVKRGDVLWNARSKSVSFGLVKVKAECTLLTGAPMIHHKLELDPKP